MLQINKVTKYYNQTKILDDISFALDYDSITGIIAPNGTGKTTLLNIIFGLDTKSSSQIYFEDRLLDSFEAKKEVFGYMLEDLKLYPQMKVYEFIEFIEQISDYEDSYLKDILKLDNILHKSIDSLSKGYHQRLKLFFALNNTKPIILLDEPFDGFDVVAMQDIIKLIKYRQSNHQSFLLCIHQLFDAQKICDNFVLLNDSKLIASGDISTLQERFSLGSQSSLEDILIKAISE